MVTTQFKTCTMRSIILVSPGSVSVQTLVSEERCSPPPARCNPAVDEPPAPCTLWCHHAADLAAVLPALNSVCEERGCYAWEQHLICDKGSPSLNEWKIPQGVQTAALQLSDRCEWNEREEESQHASYNTGGRLWKENALMEGGHGPLTNTCYRKPWRRRLFVSLTVDHYIIFPAGFTAVLLTDPPPLQAQTSTLSQLTLTTSGGLVPMSPSKLLIASHFDCNWGVHITNLSNSKGLALI